MGFALTAGGDRTAGHDADQMGAVLRAGVNIRVQVVVGNLNVGNRIGGEIGVESEAGKGSTFTMKLPAVVDNSLGTPAKK